MRSAQALNEARHTRTPCTYLFDSGMHPHPANYGVTGSLEFGSALFLSQIILTAVKRGKRKEQFLFAKIIRLQLKKILRKQGITKLSSEKMKSTLIHKATFFKPWKRRIAFLRYNKKKPFLSKLLKTLRKREICPLSNLTSPDNYQQHYTQRNHPFPRTPINNIYRCNLHRYKTELRFKFKTSKKDNNLYNKLQTLGGMKYLNVPKKYPNKPERIKINSTFNYFDLTAILQRIHK
jgi:hypothetical protein